MNRSMRHITLRFLLLILVICTGSTRGDSVTQKPHCFAGIPKSTIPKSVFTLLVNKAYSVGYSEKLKDPVWSSYYVFWTDTPMKGPRPNRFQTDNRTDAKVTHNDYKQKPSRYDRGHMTPNYVILSRYGPAAQLETFLMSNICPQRSPLNQQTWRYLEHEISEEFSRQFANLWVVCGPIFKDGPLHRLNGTAAIPDAFYMILVGMHEDSATPHMLAVVMDQNVSGIQPLRKFLQTVRTVEKKTGLDFFSELPDQLENTLEVALPDEEWPLDILLHP